MQGQNGREPKTVKMLVSITHTQHKALINASKKKGIKVARFVRDCIDASPEYQLELLATKLGLESEPTQGDTK